MRLFLVLMLLGALTGAGGDPDCSHPAEEVCGGEDQPACTHPEGPGEGDTHPGHCDCPARHHCEHPCGHFLSYLPGNAAETTVESSGDPFRARLDEAPSSGFLAAPFRPPRALS